jgi:hypothetical protein
VPKVVGPMAWAGLPRNRRGTPAGGAGNACWYVKSVPRSRAGTGSRECSSRQAAMTRN